MGKVFRVCSPVVEKGFPVSSTGVGEDFWVSSTIVGEGLWICSSTIVGKRFSSLQYWSWRRLLGFAVL